MATFYASTSGSNTAPYDTWEKAANDIQDAIDLLLTGGDLVVIDDEVWDLSTALITSNIAGITDRAFYISSRSLDNSLCILRSTSAVNGVFDHNKAGNSLAFTITSVGFTKTVTHTSTAESAICNMSNLGSGTVFVDCKFYDITVDYGALTGTTNGAIIRNSSSGPDMVWNGCEFDNIDMTAGHNATGLISSGASLGLQVINTTFNEIHFTQTGSGRAINGNVFARDGIILSGVTVSNCSSTMPENSGGSNYAFFYNEDTGKNMVVDGATASGLVWSGGNVHAAFLVTKGPFTISNVAVDNCDVLGDLQNCIGCAVTVWGNFAQGTIDDIIVHDCTAQHGGAIYVSQGAGGIFTNLIAYSNVIRGRAVSPGGGGAVYFGGWGDCTLNYALCYDNIANEGGAVFAHIMSASTRAKTTIIQNCTFYNNLANKENVALGGDSIALKGYVAAFSHTANIINCISFDGGTDEIYGAEANGGTLTLTIDHCDVEGGAAAVTGEDVYTNNIADDPLFADITRSNFRILKTSPCRDAGTDVGLTHDITGQVVPVNNVPDMGAYEIKLSILANGSCASGDLFSGINRCKGNASGNLKGEL